MLIEGKKNLEFIQRALKSHLVSCSVEAMRADDKKQEQVWDPEIAETNAMLDAVEINLRQYKESEIQPAFLKATAG
jgi:hypothetical protein